MRESIGSTFIFTLVTTFTLIFAAFLVLALNYSRVYKEKNEVTGIIEKYEGLTTSDDIKDDRTIKGSLNVINAYLVNGNYIAKGRCPEGTYGFLLTEIGSKVTSPFTVADGKEKFNYCIKVLTNSKNCTAMFRVTLFYDFNLPVLGDLVKFSISGQTNEIYDAIIEDKQMHSLNLCKR